MNTSSSIARESRARQERLTAYKKLFIVGCPRSGTTWMQLLLAQNPLVATAPETQIFAYYIDPMRRQWAQERASTERQQGVAGLSRLLSENEFEELCRLSAELVLDKIAARTPSAQLIVEKSPRHALHADFIQRIWPDAYILHVVRDPRDAAVSMRSASRGWGSDWAPRNPIDAARFWREHVMGARRAAQMPLRFREIRYEELLTDPVGKLSAVYAWLGIEIAPEDCKAAVAACEFKELQKNADARGLPLPGERTPQGFFRAGTAGGWQTQLSSSAVRTIEHICAPLMDELGYERKTASRIGTAMRITTHDVVQRVRESVDWQLQRLLWRV